MSKRTILIVVALLILVPSGAASAQDAVQSGGESLTLEQAINLAISNNRSIKISQLAVDSTDEEVSAARTFRLPSLSVHTLVSGNLAKNELQVQNPAANIFPGLGPFFTLNVERRPTAIFTASVIEPLSQQYRIGLRIKQANLSRGVAQAKLRLQREETIDQVKKAYYAILQTKSALSSVQEAVKSYRELDKVTGDYVTEQIMLKADLLVVQTRLAQAQYEALDLSNRLATQKEQLNNLLGRDVSAAFEVAEVPDLLMCETDLTTARKTALERRPEIQEARLRVQQATLERRIKKSEYIPDVSAGFTYLTARNFGSTIPKNFANVGIVVSWEVFDWGRKKHQLAAIDREIEQARTGLQEAENLVRIEVGEKFRKLQLSGQALRVAKLAQDSARENLRVSTGRYRYQSVLAADVLQSQASLAEASHKYQQSLLAFWTAKAEFEKALGEEQ